MALVLLAGSGYVLVDTGKSEPRARAATTTTAAEPTPAEIYQAILPSLVFVRATRAGGVVSGSGVVVNAQGAILTAHHVVAGATTIDVAFADGTTSAAVVATADA